MAIFVKCFLCLNFVLLAFSLPLAERSDTSATSERHVRAISHASNAHIISSLQIPLCSQKENAVPRSCYDAKLLGHTISGVYEIDPRDGLGSFNVYCDMKTDGGGWTVFQRRKDGSEDFFRNWNNYVEGFGELYGEFWLGLNKIHRLAVDVTLRVDLMASDHNKAYAQYEDFTVGNSKSMYVMYIGSYSGTAGDSLTYHNGMKFTTKDKDNDQRSTSNCAAFYLGAFWYNDCYYVNLNSRFGHAYISWSTFAGKPLRKVEMKLK